MKKYVDPWLPLYYVIPLALVLTINNTVYYLPQVFCADWYHWNMELWIDRQIPVIPAFVSVYFFFFIFAVGNYILFAHLGKKRAYQMVLTDIISKLVCGICFFVIPTTNVRPVNYGSGFWSSALGFLYQIDPPVNLFPSIHCLVSWICFIGVRSSKKLPLWYRIVTCILALLICFSTLATRQHVIADVFSAIALAEVVHFLVCRMKWAERLGADEE